MGVISINELYHHGILGQKWGQKNDPPYPLGSAYSSVEKTPSSVVGKIGSLFLTGGKAKELIGKGSNWLSDTGYLSREPDAKVKQTTQKAGLKLKTSHQSMSEDCAETDPDFTPYGSAIQRNNCAHCSVALAMRRMGYDVEAKDLLENRENGTMFKDLEKYFDTLNHETIYIGNHVSASEYEKALSEQLLKACNNENGAVGIMLVGFSTGGGHYITWENQNGTIQYADGQNNVSDILLRVFKGIKNGQIIRGARIARLDDVTINTDTIGEVVKSK
ncbi:MAG: hypothetical protein LIO74_05050 [Ruminococcus sp.]|nr:hypothetical protein [Ruminococcus sp.]